MRRILAVLAATLGLAVGSVVAAPQPVDAGIDTPTHFVSSHDSFLICNYIATAAYGVNGSPFQWRSIHYAGTDLTQCYIHITNNGTAICAQHVWGTGTFWYLPVGGDTSPCW